MCKLPVQNHDGFHSIRTFESSGRDQTRRVNNFNVQTNGIFWNVFGKVSHGVEYGLLIEFISCGIDDDGSIYEVSRPIGSAS